MSDGRWFWITITLGGSTYVVEQAPKASGASATAAAQRLGRFTCSVAWRRMRTMSLPGKLEPSAVIGHRLFSHETKRLRMNWGRTVLLGRLCWICLDTGQSCWIWAARDRLYMFIL